MQILKWIVLSLLVLGTPRIAAADGGITIAPTIDRTGGNVTINFNGKIVNYAGKLSDPELKNLIKSLASRDEANWVTTFSQIASLDSSTQALAARIGTMEAENAVFNALATSRDEELRAAVEEIRTKVNTAFGLLLAQQPAQALETVQAAEHIRFANGATNWLQAVYQLDVPLGGRPVHDFGIAYNHFIGRPWKSTVDAVYLRVKLHFGFGPQSGFFAAPNGQRLPDDVQATRYQGGAEAGPELQLSLTPHLLLRGHVGLGLQYLALIGAAFGSIDTWGFTMPVVVGVGVRVHPQITLSLSGGVLCNWSDLVPTFKYTGIGAETKPPATSYGTHILGEFNVSFGVW